MKKKISISIFLLVVVIAVALLYAKRSVSAVLLLDDFEGEISSSTVDYGVGGGSEMQVVASGDIKYHGQQSVKLEYNSVKDGYMWMARGCGLDVKGAAKWLVKPENINWSKYSAFSFYIYGTNSGTSIAVDIIDSGFEYFRFMIKDDFSGWKQIICPFDQFFARGDWQPNKAQTNAKLDFPVYSFQFEPRSLTKGTVYFDYVHLIGKK
jgi:hypothetical protein